MDKWKKRWEEKQLRWHKDQVDPFLVKYLAKLQEETREAAGSDKTKEEVASASSASLKFFVPLCGKSLDVAYILSLGHSVFAVEGVRKAVETLNEENDFGLEYDELDSTYRGLGGKLQIWLGDLFTCPIEKWAAFDFVWDKGSLTAIDEDMREGYAQVMRKSVTIPGTDQYADFRYLLRAVEYNKTKSDGRGPKCVTREDLEEMYGSWAEVTLVESVPLPETHICRRNADIDKGEICHENIYLLRRKQ